MEGTWGFSVGTCSLLITVIAPVRVPLITRLAPGLRFVDGLPSFFSLGFGSVAAFI
jgi:hypothetical protein